MTTTATSDAMRATWGYELKIWDHDAYVLQLPAPFPRPIRGVRRSPFLTCRPGARRLDRSTRRMPAPRPAPMPVIDCCDAAPAERRSAAWSSVASMALVVAIVALSALACIH